MPRRFNKKRCPFISLPRHKRTDAVIKMKGDIKREASQYGGMFISPSVMDETHQSSWCDFYFLGLDKFTIWNATIITAKCALQDVVHDLAYQQTVEMMTAEELEEECRVEFVPADRSKTGKIITYQMLEQEQKRYDHFYEHIEKIR